jgi:hypothetical protein
VLTHLRYDLLDNVAPTEKAMANYPAYIQRMIEQAREQGQWYCGQAGAAAICFDVLALFPDHRQAADLIATLFCDEWLIYDTRNALQQQIEEWDDRPWQQRRRLALSLRMLSRWDGWHADLWYAGPADIAAALQAGRDLLLEAYCLGDEECTDLAWPVFVDALRATSDPQGALMWVGRLYAELGFFADSAEVLGELCARFGGAAMSARQANARRLLAEVCWWRDNAPRLPWLPPPGDGARYRRMMALIDPSGLDAEAAMRERRARPAPEPGFARVSVVSPAMAELVAAALPDVPAPGQAQPALVDWSFLDRDDGQPGPLPEWAARTASMFEGELAADIVRRHRWSRPIPQPTTPRRLDPSAPPFDPDEFLDLDGGHSGQI